MSLKQLTNARTVLTEALEKNPLECVVIVAMPDGKIEIQWSSMQMPHLLLLTKYLDLAIEDALKRQLTGEMK